MSESGNEVISTGSDQPRTYRAFISYHHADNKIEGRQWATWIHHMLETYEVPADFVGTKNNRGELIPERIFPVYRDEEELPDDADLASPIYKALDNSEYLVVICSPRAVQSLYVANEIAYFKKIGKAERVLAMIIDGEPNASLDEGKQSSGFTMDDECFPKPLLFEVDNKGELTDNRTEPIAADFRLIDHTTGKRSEGWTSPTAYREALKRDTELSDREISDAVKAYAERLKLMKLKIIAGVLGVRRDDVPQPHQVYQLRQERKKRRIHMTVVGVLSVITVIAAVIAGVQYQVAEKYKAEAVRQRGEAEAQKRIAEEQRQQATEHAARADAAATRFAKERDAAESLANYMLVDLRDSLVPVGRLDLLQGPAERVKAYYEQAESEGEATPDRQRARGVALNNLGNVYIKLGDLDSAMELYEASMKISQSLVALDPDNTQWQRRLSVSWDKVGTVRKARGDLNGALEAYEASLKNAQTLVALDPDNSQWQTDLSVSWNKVGDVRLARGDLDGALEAYEASFKIRQSLVTLDPDNTKWQRRLSISWERVGVVRQARGDLDGALEACEASVKILQSLSALDPANTQWQSDLSVSWDNVGDVRQARGDLDGALEAYEASMKICQSLVVLDPSNTQWQRYLLTSWYRVGSVRKTRGDLDGALEAYEASLKIAQSLALKMRGSILARTDVVWSSWTVAFAMLEVTPGSEEGIGLLKRAKAEMEQIEKEFDLEGTQYDEWSELLENWIEEAQASAGHATTQPSD